VVSAQVEVQVVRPLAVALVANESSVHLGQSVRFSADVLGGAAPLTASWSGLPSGCPSSSTGFNVTCMPSATGTFHVSVRVDDSAGETRYGNATVVVSGPTTPAGAATSWTTWAVLGAVVVVLAAVAVASVVLWRRRARPRP
jgi:hypothetical protein